MLISIGLSLYFKAQQGLPDVLLIDFAQEYMGTYRGTRSKVVPNWKGSLGGPELEQRSAAPSSGLTKQTSGKFPTASGGHLGQFGQFLRSDNFIAAPDSTGRESVTWAANQPDN